MNLLVNQNCTGGVYIVLTYNTNTPNYSINKFSHYNVCICIICSVTKENHSKSNRPLGKRHPVL